MTSTVLIHLIDNKHLLEPLPDLSYSLKVLPAGDLKACKLHSVPSEDELVRVEGDAVFATDVQPVTRLEEALINTVCPKECVIHTLCLVGYIRDDFVEAPGITVSRSNVSLRSIAISISSPRVMKIVKCLITIPCIEDSLLLAMRN